MHTFTSIFRPLGLYTPYTGNKIFKIYLSCYLIGERAYYPNLLMTGGIAVIPVPFQYSFPADINLDDCGCSR